MRRKSKPLTKAHTAKAQGAALWASSFAFTICFAVWTIFAIIGIKIQQELGLTESQLGLLIGTPVLTGSLIRVPLGVWSEQYGGRIVTVLVMLAAAAATWLLTYAATYEHMLFAALGIGIAGGSFSSGVAYVARWFPPSKAGLALGIFGAGNVGAAVTKLLAPQVMQIGGSWHSVAYVWAIALVVTALVFWFTTTDDPALVRQRKSGKKPKSTWLELAPLSKLQVWRFSLYYFFVFGGFIALAAWLPKYLTAVYAFSLPMAGVIAACFSIPASIFRIYGGYLSDRHGARKIMYWTLSLSVITLFILCYPPTRYGIETAKGTLVFHMATGAALFTVIVFILGFAMALGKAAVYKHIPVYYPHNVGAVGGLVGMIGGLGGFILPIVFGRLLDMTGIYTTCFMVLFLIAGVSLLWMHFSIRAMEQNKLRSLKQTLPEFPELK
ncbi:MAG: Major facilitator transporter family protein [Candidatus Tokpelaia hoelldobleri]|uniref:Major facilitator transporter family protein n=1 Tax=Candidatus Tokpelaia hoelldobleri TaxID=1902579 RepID=A0A1U9JV72_9HYPH|nr:MAG: Major facilitator transporter family protein [Candidatus Tokpelaia hoelldoblerii]